MAPLCTFLSSCTANFSQFCVAARFCKTCTKRQMHTQICDNTQAQLESSRRETVPACIIYGSICSLFLTQFKSAVQVGTEFHMAPLCTSFSSCTAIFCSIRRRMHTQIGDSICNSYIKNDCTDLGVNNTLQVWP